MWVSRLSWLLHVLYVPKILGWVLLSKFSHRITHSRCPADCMTMQRLEPDRSLAIRGLRVPWPDFSRIFSVCVLIISFDTMEQINRRAVVLVVTYILTFYWYQTAVSTTDIQIDTFVFKKSHTVSFWGLLLLLLLLLLIFPSSCFDDFDGSGWGRHRRSCGYWRYITQLLGIHWDEGVQKHDQNQ